jgi:peptide/nickel transport system substrate-binding protein
MQHTGFSRRSVLQGVTSIATVGALTRPGLAADKQALTIAYPVDVPTWDPNARLLIPAQPIYKCVFDSPLTQDTDLTYIPNFATRWAWQDPTTLELELRTDSVFHDGVPVTAEDFRYTFYDRVKTPPAPGQRSLDFTFIWRRIKDIEIASPARVVIRFEQIMPTAVKWLGFQGSYIMPKHYVEKVGLDGFLAKPIGSGPYRVVEYIQNSRITLEAFGQFRGGAPKIKRVTFLILRDPAVRVAALESGEADMAVDVPVREAERLANSPKLTARIDPFTDIMMLQLTGSGGFQAEEARLAAHHAINKEALSKAFFAGKAVPIPVLAPPNTPGNPKDFVFPFSEGTAIDLLKKIGHGPENPLSIKFFATNGAYPSDFDVARAITAMWKKVGIAAELETIEPAKYQELSRAGKLPEATLFQWGNSSGDPEMYSGYILDPKSIFSVFKSPDLGEMLAPLLVETDEAKRFAGYRALNAYATRKGYTIPLLQTVKTASFARDLNFKTYDNGWILPQTYSWQS